jgi:hypothetical protein
MWRLLITIIVGLFIITSCNPSSGQMSDNYVDSVKQTISSLRQFGFFEKYKSLSDKQLFDTLHQQRIADYSKMFERFYDPGMKLETYQILMLDRDRTVYGDAESDVGKDNNQYISLLNAFSMASGGLFNPKDITEKWDSEKGPVHVSFTENGEEILFEPEYLDDWLSEKVFEVINQQMTKNGKEKFYMFLGSDGWGLGQYFLYIRMAESQKQELQKAFGWKFTD